MNKLLSVIWVLMLCLYLCACGENSTAENPYEKYAKYEELFIYLETNDFDKANAYIHNFFGINEDMSRDEHGELPTEPLMVSAEIASPLTSEQQLVVEAVRATIQSEKFAEWQSLYREFMGKDPKTPEVTSVIRYQIGSFEGEKMDCYLLNVSADAAYWENKEAEKGAVVDQFQIFVDTKTKTTYDSITTDAGNFNGDISTSQGRAIYLLWSYGGLQSGFSEGILLNDAEVITEFTEADIAAISNALAE